ncbi:2-iminoacetate synthase ThiH [Chengkuizengella sediminis]|uniref:2-iminoacetate synthase ThiH n=1 Tax=Chengkuizengella sediminis TaxID=1885917 RepID=UPI0013895E82|nr:2-iminoacetate synthase ThiH [Chengkuizengella sediminis]NDI36389.1 2-iminoacetate synthase ThiH [Chengkuizengella sediminis]
MSFYETYKKLKNKSIEDIFSIITSVEIKKVLQKNTFNEFDFLVLLSPAAVPYLDIMAQKAHENTVQHFHKKIELYAPIYISDFCVNHCEYCSFSITQTFKRKKLSLSEIQLEANILNKLGFKQLLILTGESKTHIPISFLKQVITMLKNQFDSVSIEIQPMDTTEYEDLVASGTDGVTVYQEVYDEEMYKKVHVKGPKRNYQYRIDTPERACRAGMSKVNMGALLGLADWRKEAYYLAMHVNYLQEKYPNTQIGLSFPRIRPHLGDFEPVVDVTDQHLMQMMLAMRLFLPECNMNLSTRESPTLRDELLSYGVTNLSAASCTAVGGYANQYQMETANHQFDISDERSVEEIVTIIKQKGYQPV